MWFEYMGNKKITFPLKKKKEDLLNVTNGTGLLIFLSTVEMNSLFCSKELFHVCECMLKIVLMAFVLFRVEKWPTMKCEPSTVWT